MTALLELLERLDRTFEGSDEGMVARKLFYFLRKHPETTHITLQLVRQISWTPDELSSQRVTRTQNALSYSNADTVVVRTLQYLSAGADSVLEAKFELIEEDREEFAPHILSADDLNTIMIHGVNPISGEHDPCIKSKVVIFFAPTCHMQSLLADFAASGKAKL